MIKLSFIVPVYKVAPYVCKCIDSLLAQDYKNYEIILVDDGSPDDCPQICDSYADIHDHICVIHQDNGGLSAARNAGLKAAKGEYICFVDSDDYWEPNVLKGLLEQMERDNLDVLRFNYQNVNERYEVFSPNKAPKRDVDYSETVTDGETFLNDRLGPACYAVMFVMRRDILDDCVFKEGIYFEDVEWTPRMLLKAKRVASTTKMVYNYLWRTGSITLPTNLEKKKKVIEDKIALIKGFNEHSEIIENTTWFTWMTSSTAMSILAMLSAMPFSERKQYLRELKSLRIFPLSIKRERMLFHRIKTILANISPSLYCHLMSLRK